VTTSTRADLDRTPPPVPGLRRRLAASGRRFLDPRYLILGITALIVAFLALVPLATMVIASLRTFFLEPGAASWSLEHYTQELGSGAFWAIAGNSLIYASSTSVICIVVGFGLAWLVARTNTPARAFATVAAIVPLIVPGILNTVAWGLLFSPSSGPLNELLNAIGLPSFNIDTLPGMVFVQSMHAAPLAFLMGLAAFSTMDGSMEEAALASGASPRQVFGKITLRLVRPAILSAVLLTFIQTIASFEVPELLGEPGRVLVFTSAIYTAMQTFPPSYGTVGVIGVVVLVLAALCLVAAQRLSRRGVTQTISGKGFRPSIQDLGKWRWGGFAVFVIFTVIVVAAPLAMLVWSSVLPGYENPSLHALHDLTLANFRNIATAPSLVSSIRNSLITALAAGVIVTLLSTIIAYITVKTKIRGRALLDGLATAPIAVPSVVIGVGILYFYLVAPLPFHLYGTKAILVIAFVTISLPYGVRYLTPGMDQIKDELEEAATASGASWLQAFRRVYVPLLVPSLTAAFLYAVILSFREISSAVFLYSQGSQVVSVSIFQLWASGNYPTVAALGVVMLVFLVVMVALVRLVSGRFGLRQQQL
jgi:iron(III) transport system permease protein